MNPPCILSIPFLRALFLSTIKSFTSFHDLIIKNRTRLTTRGIVNTTLKLFYVNGVITKGHVIVVIVERTYACIMSIGGKVS